MLRWIADRVVGFCLTLLLVRKDVTKETLVNGVGLRFAIANWLMAAWAVCFVCFFLSKGKLSKGKLQLMGRVCSSSLVPRLSF
jgi:hypothetical protein